MTTFKLLWGATWRGGGMGLLAGTLGGAGYGALFANVLLAFGVMAQAPFKAKSEDVVGALAAVLLFALIGSVIGAMFGVPTGLVVGIANGLLLGVMTRALFYPLKDARRHRWVSAIVSAVFTGVLAWLCFFSIMLFYANRERADEAALAVIVAIPALIAGVGAGLLSRLISRWYESNFQSPTIKES